MGSFSVLMLFSGRHLMHVRRLLALALAGPVLMAGCSDQAEPTPKMPDPTSTSAETVPTETETPEAESAEDFIRRWVEVGDTMQVTGKTADYRAITDDSCKACRAFEKTVRDVYEGGGSIEFAGTTVDRVVRREKAPPTFALTKTLPETVVRRGGAADVETLPAGTTTLLVILDGDPGDWSVKYYGVL